MKQLIYLFLLFFIINLKYKCYASQCEVAQVCVTDLSEQECGAGMQLIDNFRVFDCCPGCGPLSGGGDDDNEIGKYFIQI